jgi:hypothetical protein
MSFGTTSRCFLLATTTLSYFLLLSFQSLPVFSLSASPQKQSNPATQPRVTRIEACENKDCCRNFGLVGSSLPQILRDLTDSKIEVETTGCLSQCEHGPNMRVSLQSNKGKEEQNDLQGIKDHIRVAAELDALGVTVPPKFVAACTVLEKAHQSK